MTSLPSYAMIVTHLGSSSLMLPVMTITAMGLRRSHQEAALRIWLLAITVAVTMTLATKIAFLGWGIGILSVNFTGISGHTLLATSVLPLLFCSVLANDQRRFMIGAAVLGLLVGGVVGASRVLLGAHSISEVFVAWLTGLAVSSLALNALQIPIRPPWFSRLSPLVLLLALNTTTSTYLPTHEWEVRLALLLSGHERPYTRPHLISNSAQVDVLTQLHPQ